MRIKLNGETHEVADDIDVAGLIQALELAGRRIAVDVNGEIVPRSQHGSRRLAADDQVEIVHAVGGG